MIPRPTSLRGLTILFLGLFLAATIGAGLTTFYATLSAIDDLVDRRIARESHDLAPVDVRPGPADLKRRIEELGKRRDTGDLGILLTDARGHRLVGNVTLSRQLPLGFSAVSSEDGIKGLSAGRALVREVGGGMRLAVLAETEPIDHYFAARRRLYLLGFGAIVLVVLGGLIMFRRLVAQRIEAMRLTADSIIDGDLSRRVPLNGDGGEFDQQAAAFNRMLDRMNALMGEIRNVSNNISHELRTPLARLRNELALIGSEPGAEPVRAHLARATEQADELLAMFGAMLRIAEIESGSRRAGFRPVDLAALVEEALETMQPVAEENGRWIAIGPPGEARIEGDRLLLLQMLLNLLENSLRHAAGSTRLTISLARAQGRVMLCVEDDGPGIPPDQRSLVMRRFGRLERSGRGHGLGLPLASAIARLHGGELLLEDAGPGLRVLITLPG